MINVSKEDVRLAIERLEKERDEVVESHKYEENFRKLFDIEILLIMLKKYEENNV